MTINATKLIDLIERGRTSGPAARIISSADVATEGTSTQSMPAVSAVMPIVKDIESLAVKLFSISRASTTDPRELMCEALRSIESCIVAMKRQN